MSVTLKKETKSLDGPVGLGGMDIIITVTIPAMKLVLKANGKWEGHE